MKKFLTVFLVAILAISLAACGSSGTDGKPDKVIMGFVPSTESDKIASTVEPLRAKLAEELGVEVEASVMTNYTALVEAMGSGQVHIGFIPAFGYVQANDRHDIEVILKSVRNGSGTYQAQYVVRADSGIETLADLEGKVWAFADATSTSGFLFPAAQLMGEFDIANTDALQTEFFSNAVSVGSHDNAALTVLDGGADVATTFDDVREVLVNDYPTIMEDLKVIAKTEPIPNDTISVIKELDEEFVQQIKDAFLSFNDDQEMLDVMNEVYRWTAIEEANDAEYDIIRETMEKTGFEG